MKERVRPHPGQSKPERDFRRQTVPNSFGLEQINVDRKIAARKAA